MKKISYLFCTFFLSIILSTSFSQSGFKKPFVNVSVLLLNSSEFLIKYNLVATNEVAIHKELIKCIKCDAWFMDVVIMIEKFDPVNMKYLSIPCSADIQPAIRPDGTLGEMIKLYNSKTPDFNCVINKKSLPQGDYRIKIKFYYFLNDERMFSESEYVQMIN